MKIEGKTAKGTPLAINLKGTSSIDCTATITVAQLTNERLDRHAGGMTYRMDTPKDGATHYILAGKTGIALTETEAVRIDAEYHAWIESLPGTAHNRLHARRETLVGAISGILDDIGIRRERWFEAECKTGSLPDYDDISVQQAREALAAFDAEHPEIKVELETRRKADIERHLWD